VTVARRAGFYGTLLHVSRTPKAPDDRNETWPATTVLASTPPGPPEDRYEVLAERARGGLGRVVEARDRRLHRVVAVKELLHRDAAGEARFVREAFITARLEHPSIVPVYDAATNPEGAPFYVMKLVNGRTLEDLVQRHATLRERLALLPNVIAVADAIAYAHSQGVLHRDIKGSNVIVGDFGETIVIDWGLAKRVADSDDGPAATPRDGSDPQALPEPASTPEQAEALTIDGAILGTPLFMAPEQARGERADTRTDVFALGALLYFVLCGKAPYQDVEVKRMLEEIRAGRIRAVRDREPGVAPDLAAIVEKATAPDRSSRYPTARELADDLRAYRNGDLVAAYHYTARDKLARGVRRHLGVTLATGAFALVGAAAFGVVALREQGLRESAEASRDRAAAEQVRADRQSLALLEQQGRDELESGRPFRAAVLLAGAYERDPGSLAMRSLVTEALRPLAAHRLSLVGHVRDVPAGAYSPDGALVATGSDDRTVRLWDVRTGAMLHTIDGFQGALEAVAFSHDGRALVASSAGQHPRITTWEVPSGRALGAYDLSPANFRVEFTPDDAAIVVGGFDGDLRVVDRASGAVRLDLRPCRDRISAIDFRAGTSQMVIASHDHTASVWDWREGKRVASLPAFDRSITTAHYSKDGRYLLVGEDMHHIHVYDAASLERLRTIHAPDSAQDPDAYFSPDARLVVSGTKDGRIRVWHTSSGALLRLIDAQPAGQLYRTALRADGKEVATMGGDGAVNLWSLETDLDYRLLDPRPIDDTSFLGSAYVDDGRAIVVPGSDGVVHVLDAATGESQRSFRVDMDADTIAIDPGATRLAATGETTTGFPPRLFDLQTGTLVARLQPHTGPQAYGLAAAGGDPAFFTGDYVGVVREWDWRAGAMRAEHAVTSARISSLASSPGGATLAVANEHGTVFLVDRATGQTRRTLHAHNCWIQSLLFADGGRTLVTVGRQDHTLRIWREPFDGPPIVLSGHDGSVRRASMSDDGRRIASASGDGTARVWDARTGQLLRVIHGPSTTALFRPGGDELLTTGEKGYAVVWASALDPRTPREIAAYVAERSPWKLVDGRLQLDGTRR
jgi:WD40 repeat protein/tRNA A-37 threonylcarbamoyl transferase component Bud32